MAINGKIRRINFRKESVCETSLLTSLSRNSIEKCLNASGDA